MRAERAEYIFKVPVLLFGVCFGWGETRQTQTDKAILGVGLCGFILIRIGIAIQFYKDNI